ncbi:abortive infection family protein [Telluribacter sp. SYSU D00476]|uniref:abortive infection family protein n=1 Tax=Telluribacter sp. SYSU D00476 TaxID=2811430 RepID=UPI001FF678AB|nr:abortive infection family protein [Telluribacter sp. SYSU D00476]
MSKNRITDVTRRRIADEMTIGNMWYHGNLTEPDFLARMFDLKSLPSRDYRYTNAYDDIYQHMVNNNDWEEDWIYSDPRINLSHCDDETYLKFLAMTVHPRVRSNSDEVVKLIEIYNRHLSTEGFVIVQTDEISSKPVFSGRLNTIGQTHLAAKNTEIKKYLNTTYVNGKINTMSDAIQKDTDLAIGTAKELLETTCKSILRQKSVVLNPDWTLPQLIKATTNSLDFSPKEANDPEKAEKAIKQILGGIASIVQGVGELRNGYGTGHGKDADFKGLEIKYAKLLVGVVSEIVILYLATNGETAELIETGTL